MILWGALSPLSSWSAFFATVYILQWQLLHMHEDSICGNIMQGLSTLGWLKKPQRGGVSVWSGIAGKAEKLASAETHGIWLISQESCNQRASYCRSPRVYAVQCIENRKSFLNWSGDRERRRRHIQFHSVHPESSEMWKIHYLRSYWGNDLTNIEAQTFLIDF